MSGEKRKVSLVLGSGGARGHAHIGVIRAVRERGWEIRNIAGTSMGALIGGIYAADQLDVYSDWAGQLEQRDVVKLLDLSFSRKSLFKGERIFEVLEDLVGDCRIEELDTGFTAVATWIEEQREVWLNTGPLFRALRASCAVPGVFLPVEHQGMTLVDGGLVNPIPIAPTLNDTTDLTLAVNLNSVQASYNRPEKYARRSEADGQATYREKISAFIADLLSIGGPAGTEPDAIKALASSIDIMQGAIARLKLAAYNPDRVIEIPRDACSFFEFHRAEEMAELGYETTCRVLDRLDD